MNCSQCSVYKKNVVVYVPRDCRLCPAQPGIVRYGSPSPCHCKWFSMLVSAVTPTYQIGQLLGWNAIQDKRIQALFGWLRYKNTSGPQSVRQTFSVASENTLEATFHASMLKCCAHFKLSEMWIPSSLNTVTCSISVPSSINDGGAFLQSWPINIPLRFLPLMFIWHWLAWKAKSSTTNCMRLVTGLEMSSVSVVSSIYFRQPEWWTSTARGRSLNNNNNNKMTTYIAP